MKHIVVIPLILMLAGCSFKSAPLKSYTLDGTEYSPRVYLSSKYHNKIIKVSYPESIKEKMTHKMHYSYSASEQGDYQNSQWTNNIGKLLQGTVVQALGSSRLFKAVLPISSNVAEDYRLENSIFTFSHRVRGAESHAVVSIQFSLLDAHTGALLKSKQFRYKVPTRTIDAAGYVGAANEAMSRLNVDLIEWLQ